MFDQGPGVTGRRATLIVPLVLALSSIVLLTLWPKSVRLPGVPLNMFSVVQIVFLVALGGSVVLRRGRHPDKAYRTYITLFSILVCAELLSLVLGGPDTDPTAWARQVVQVKSLFVVGVFVGSDARRFALTLRTLALAMSVAFIIAIAERLFNQSAFALLARYMVVEDGDALSALAAAKSRSGMLRASALFDHPIVLSIAAGMTIPLYLAIAGEARTAFRRLMWLSFVGLALIAGSYSLSRTYIVASGVAVAAFTALYSLHRSVYGRGGIGALWILAAVVAIAALSPWLGDVMAGRTALEDYSTRLRSAMWEGGLPYFFDRPLLGWGYGSDLAYGGMRLGKVATIDDSYLSILINGGLIGLFLFIAFFLSIMGCGLKVIVSTGSWHRVSPVAAVLSGLVAIAVCQRWNSIPAMLGYFFLFAGMIVGSVRHIGQRSI